VRNALRRHITYCYCCRQRVEQHVSFVLVKRRAGWGRSVGLCRTCHGWLMDVLELARGAEIDWINQ
jgi:hypothetical protein